MDSATIAMIKKSANFGKRLLMNFPSLRCLATIVAGFCCLGSELKFVRADTDPRKPAAIDAQEVPQVPPELLQSWLSIKACEEPRSEVGRPMEQES